MTGKCVIFSKTQARCCDGTDSCADPISGITNLKRPLRPLQSLLPSAATRATGPLTRPVVLVEMRQRVRGRSTGELRLRTRHVLLMAHSRKMFGRNYPPPTSFPLPNPKDKALQRVMQVKHAEHWTSRARGHLLGVSRVRQASPAYSRLVVSPLREIVKPPGASMGRGFDRARRLPGAPQGVAAHEIQHYRRPFFRPSRVFHETQAVA